MLPVEGLVVPLRITDQVVPEGRPFSLKTTWYTFVTVVFKLRLTHEVENGGTYNWLVEVTYPGAESEIVNFPTDGSHDKGARDAHHG